jgi:hypothetical protein
MLKIIAIANLALSVALAVWALADVHRRPPKMLVMKWVWPLTFLWGGLFALVLYLWFGRAQAAGDKQQRGKHPLWQSVALGVTHCGAGCSLADMLVEAGMFVFGLGFVVLGHEVFGNWIVDYVFALIFGVIFQYAAKVAMSDKPNPTIWWEAFKTDFWSLTSWQIGMYGWMAISIFLLFDQQTMKPDHWPFWLMMQVAMLCGFVTAYPANWVLISKRFKERM